MRPDEIHAMTALCEYLYYEKGCFPTEILQEPFGNSTPPDFIIKLAQKDIAIEVTQTGHGFLLVDNANLSGNPIDDGEDKIRYESSARNLLMRAFKNDIEKKGNWIKKGESIVVTYISPIPTQKRSSLARKILSQVKHMYHNNQLLDSKEIAGHIKPELTVLTGQSEIKGVSIEIFKTNYYESSDNYSPIIENFFCSFYSPKRVYDTSLSAQVFYILVSIISKKKNKCAQLQIPKWLVLVNTHHILEYNDYKQFFNENAEFIRQYDFDKFYLIENGKCLEL